jgi:hypothetical protein
LGAANTISGSLSEEKMSTRDAAEMSKLEEIMRLLESLQKTAHQLSADADRQDALREIRGFQLRAAAFIRRLALAA